MCPSFLVAPQGLQDDIPTLVYLALLASSSAVLATSPHLTQCFRSVCYPHTISSNQQLDSPAAFN